MILYSITVSVDSDIAPDWLEWMQETHIPAVMGTGYFTGYTVQELLDPPPQAGTFTFNIQYVCASLAQYEAYQQNAAQALQRDHVEKYQEKAVAFRTLLRQIDRG